MLPSHYGIDDDLADGFFDFARGAGPGIGAGSPLNNNCSWLGFKSRRLTSGLNLADASL